MSYSATQLLFPPYEGALTVLSFQVVVVTCLDSQDTESDSQLPQPFPLTQQLLYEFQPEVVLFGLRDVFRADKVVEQSIGL